MEPIGADALPGLESRSSQYCDWELGSGGGVAPGPSPAALKGSRTFIVAAGGCPAPFRRNGVRRLKGAASRRGAGLTADLPRLRRGKGDEG
jgi:hypothetical protein